MTMVEDSPVSIDAEGDFWNVSVPTTGMPLSDQKTVRQHSSGPPPVVAPMKRGSFAVQSTDDLLKILGASIDNADAEGKAMKRFVCYQWFVSFLLT